MFIPEVLRAKVLKPGVVVVLVHSFLSELHFFFFAAVNDRCTSSSKYCATCSVADVAVITLQQLKVRLILRQHPDIYHFGFCIT